MIHLTLPHPLPHVIGGISHKTPEDLLRDAGTAMNNAKKKGDPKIEIFMRLKKYSYLMKNTQTSAY